jgi:hypothetical protein
MTYRHIPTDVFLKDARDIKKDYPEFGNDLKGMRKRLNRLSSFKNQSDIDDLGHGLFKLRLEITGKRVSKSYGARIIFFFITTDSEIWYLTCYDKSDTKDITQQETKRIRKLTDQIVSTSPLTARLQKFGSVTLSRLKK